MDHLQALPCELLLKIFSNIALDDKFRISRTCRHLRCVSRDPSLYRDLVIQALSPRALTKLLDALGHLHINLSSLNIADTNPKMAKLGSRSPPPAIDYLGYSHAINEEKKHFANGENDPRVVLNAIITFLNQSDTSGLTSLVCSPVLWSGCQTDKILEGLSGFGAKLKHLRFPTQGQLFSDTFINLTTETPLMERVSGILWTPTPRAVMSVATNWRSLKILEICDDHAGHEISNSLGMVFANCRQLEVVRIHQVVPDEAGWKSIAKVLDDFPNTRKSILRRTRSYIGVMNDDDDEFADYSHIEEDEGDEVDEEGDSPMKDVYSSSPSNASSSSYISADRVRYLELSIMCYCRNAPRILTMDTCRILQRVFPGVKTFRYHYEGALRGADIESTRNNLNEFARKWVGKNGTVDVVC